MKDNSKEPRPIPELLLERARHGELPEPRLSEVRAAIDAQPEATARLEALEASDAAILAEHTPEAMTAAILRRQHMAKVQADVASEKSRTAAPMWMGALLAGAAAVALAFAFMGDGQPPGIAGRHVAGPDMEVTREKGLAPHLQIHRQTSDGSELLEHRAAAQQNDVLQVKYVAMDRPHGVIFSVDGNGSVTLHFPSEPGQPTDLSQDGGVPLPHSYKLDDAPRFERFFFITAQKPLDVTTIMSAGRALAQNAKKAERADLALPDDLEQTSFIVRKVAQ